MKLPRHLPQFVPIPELVAPAPDRLSAAVHEQAARPGVQNPHSTAWWIFDGARLVPAERVRRYRSLADEVAAQEKA